MRSVRWSANALNALLALTVSLPGLALAANESQHDAQNASSSNPPAMPGMVSEPAGHRTLPQPSALFAPPVDGLGAVVRLDELEQYRGGSDINTTINSIRPKGTVDNNAAVNVVTGANYVSEGSFANASGLPVVIQNSGANVLIQNATIVNVRLH